MYNNPFHRGADSSSNRRSDSASHVADDPSAQWDPYRLARDLNLRALSPGSHETADLLGIPPNALLHSHEASSSHGAERERVSSPGSSPRDTHTRQQALLESAVQAADRQRSPLHRPSVVRPSPGSLASALGADYTTAIQGYQKNMAEASRPSHNFGADTAAPGTAAQHRFPGDFDPASIPRPASTLPRRGLPRGVSERTDIPPRPASTRPGPSYRQGEAAPPSFEQGSSRHPLERMGQPGSSSHQDTRASDAPAHGLSQEQLKARLVDAAPGSRTYESGARHVRNKGGLSNSDLQFLRAELKKLYHGQSTTMGMSNYSQAYSEHYNGLKNLKGSHLQTDQSRHHQEAAKETAKKTHRNWGNRAQPGERWEIEPRK